MSIRIAVLGIVASVIIGIVSVVMFIQRVPVGHVGVIVNLLGSDKGVDVSEVSPGRHFVGINQQLYIFPTFTQTVGWTKGSNPELGSPNNEEVTFQTTEGLVVSGDVGASISVDPTKVSILFQKYRKGMDEIVDIFVRSNIQDAIVRRAGTMGIESVYGMGKNELIDLAFKDVKEDMAKIGINIEKMYWIGQIRLPQNVITAINSKIAATQEAEQRKNEVEKAKAQADIDRAKAQGEADSVLIAAKSQAQANNLLSQSITENLVKYKTLERWDGKLPQVTGGSTPMLQLK